MQGKIVHVKRSNPFRAYEMMREFIDVPLAGGHEDGPLSSAGGSEGKVVFHPLVDPDLRR